MKEKLSAFWVFMKRGPVIFGFITSFAAAVVVLWGFGNWVGGHVVMAGDMKPFAQQLEQIQKTSTMNSIQIELFQKQSRYNELDDRIWKIQDRYTVSGRPMPEETRESIREWQGEMKQLDREILALLTKLEQNK